MKLKYTIMYVENVKASMEFYTNAFGLKAKFLHESELYGEMESGETTLSFAEINSSKPKGIEFLKSKDHTNCCPVEIAFMTDDVHSAYKNAVEVGCKGLLAPEKKPWGQVVSYVQDLNGFLVEICSPVS